MKAGGNVVAKDEKRILHEDINDLRKLVMFYVKKGNFDKARGCEFEIEKIKEKLRDK